MSTTKTPLYLHGRDPVTGERVRVPISQAEANDLVGADLLSQAASAPSAPDADAFEQIEQGDWPESAA